MLSPNDFTAAQPVFFDAALLAALGMSVPAADLTAPLLGYADDAQDDAEEAESDEDDADETDDDEDEDESDDETDEADNAEFEAEDAPETV